jgi:gluconate kinase
LLLLSSIACTVSFSNKDLSAPFSSLPLHVVMFGRPGAGKSTVADMVVKRLQDRRIPVLGLDLDVCVSPQMRDNFRKGVYPTLAERRQFAQEACDYVENEMRRSSSAHVAIVSFSFVNTDLREIYRERFPHADWILVDTSEQEANQRIAKRLGHFYKGGLMESGDGLASRFAPVTFPHAVLSGTDSMERNADKVLRRIVEALEPAS